MTESMVEYAKENGEKNSIVTELLPELGRLLDLKIQLLGDLEETENIIKYIMDTLENNGINFNC
jgi:hypothetical protein